MSSCDLIAGSNKKYELDSAVEPQNDLLVALNFHASWRPEGTWGYNMKTNHVEGRTPLRPNIV
jgi:hypothetical protein